MPRTLVVSNGLVDADDLAAAVRALGQVDKVAKAELTKGLRGETNRVAKLARARARQKPGGGFYRALPARAIGVSTRAAKGEAALVLKGNDYPDALAAEFGAKSAATPVFRGRGKGHPKWRSQARWKRRRYPVWRGNNVKLLGRAGPGWIVQPTIRRERPRIEANLVQLTTDVYVATLRRNGITAYG